MTRQYRRVLMASSLAAAVGQLGGCAVGTLLPSSIDVPTSTDTPGDGAPECEVVCGEVCCGVGELCSDATHSCMVPCTPECEGRDCGFDGCGGTCGSAPDGGCAAGLGCVDGVCTAGCGHIGDTNPLPR